jgi:glyoxylase-like metal-dependent hydrolase (beta-lactamase superfamily II)
MRTADAAREVAPMTVVTFDAQGLGDRSYLISDGTVGVVVDAQRDPAPYIAQATKLEVSIAAVLETHIHNDYVSGGLALSRATGAIYAIPAGEAVSFAGEARSLEDGESLSAGSLEVTAIATDGHTDHHLAYLFKRPASAEGGEQVVCTGGSLLLNATGRTDLLGAEMAEGLAHAQWHSVRRLLTSLAPETRVLPTHGFGSFCSATPASGETGTVTTIAEELEKNPAIVLERDEFVAATLSSLPPIPAYYRHMAPLNRSGALAPRFEPVTTLDRAALVQAVASPRRVVDLRPRRSFADGHLAGSLNLELGANLTTYLGWLVSYETEIVLLAEEQAEIDEARGLIARIGREELSAVALWPHADRESTLGNPIDDGLASYRVASFSELAQQWQGQGATHLQVLDVRHPHEWAAGHLVGAHHIPVQDLASSRRALLQGTPVWVHCGGGYRAAAAASMLSGWGASPVLVDDSWDQAVAAGLPITDH